MAHNRTAVLRFCLQENQCLDQPILSYSHDNMRIAMRVDKSSCSSSRGGKQFKNVRL